MATGFLVMSGIMVCLELKYHTNCLSIEIQLMRRFIENMHIRSLANEDIVDVEHLSIFRDLLGANCAGSATDTLFRQTTFLTSKFSFFGNNCRCDTPFSFCAS